MSDAKQSMPPPIFVTGLPRSGTSLTAGLLAQCGIWLGTMVPGDVNNQKGYFENVYIRERLIKQVLSQTGHDPLGIHPLPPLEPSFVMQDFAQHFRDMLERDGYQAPSKILYKDAKLLLLWHVVHRAFPDSPWVLVRRSVNNFIDSCLRTGFMNQHSSKKSFWLNIAAEYLRRIDLMKDLSPHAYEFWPDRFFSEGPEYLQPLTDHLGLEYRRDRVDDFLEASVWHETNQTSYDHLVHHASNKPMDIGKHVAVVGNSGALRGGKLGSLIDEYDEVFRFNFAPTGGEFAEDVGTKTTWYVLNKKLTRDPLDDQTQKRLKSIQRSSGTICFPGYYTHLLPDADPYHLDISVREINAIFKSCLGRSYAPFGLENHPRNGIKLIAALLKRNIRPTIFGFDVDALDNEHYFDGVSQTESENGHRPSLEKRLLGQLITNSLIVAGNNRFRPHD